MPPYIRFSSHNIKGRYQYFYLIFNWIKIINFSIIIITGETFPLSLQKLLKWKLSSITPIVVRQTIQNSGFKIVKSEHSLVQATNPSIITNQSNPNAISLQNHCGILVLHLLLLVLSVV